MQNSAKNIRNSNTPDESGALFPEALELAAAQQLHHALPRDHARVVLSSLVRRGTESLENRLNDTATTEIYTRKIVGSVRCV